MRILNISFKNINSLAGEGQVYFDQGPIADSGVFAITGPNGSGKSSILDVITLGLYGETFRFDRPASHVMTKQTNECFARVEFALDGEKFRSSWSVKRSKAGDMELPAVPNMSLVRINGNEEVLADTPNQVRVRIAELTGMDFHRFSKSVVLPQGDFAAFLHALDSERMDILEKISGTDLYDEYRQQFEQQFTSAQTRLTELQQDIAGLPLLDEASLDAASHDLQDFKDQVNEYLQQEQEIRQQLVTLQNVTNLKEQQQQMQRKRQDLHDEITHYQQDLERIVQGQSAQAFATDIRLLDSKQAQVEQQQATLESYRKELGMLQRQLGGDAETPLAPLPEKSLAEQKQTVDALKLSVSELKLELPRQRELAQSIQQQLTDNEASLAELDTWLQAHQRDASLVDDFPNIVRLRNLRNELIELNNKQKANSKWSKGTLDALKKNKAALESTRSNLDDLAAQIETDQKTIQEISQGKNLDELKELQQEQQSRVNDLEEMYSLASATAKLTRKGFLGWLGVKKQTELPPDVDALQAKLDELNQEMAREQNIITVLERALRNEALIKKMTADRAKLIEGQPCYLCGSTAHPYVLKPPVLTDAKKALLDQRGKIQGLKASVDHTASQLKAAQKQGSQLSARQQRLQQMHSQWTTLANRLNVMRRGMEIDDLSAQRQILSDEIDELNRVNALLKQFTQLQQNIAQMEANIQDKKAYAEKLTKMVAELENAWNNRPPEFGEAEKLYTERSAEQKNLLEKLEKQLPALGEKLPGRGKENRLFDALNSRRQDYQVYQLRKEGLQKEIAALNEKLQTCQNNIETYQQRINNDLKDLSQQERLSLHIAIIEKQKLIVDQEQQLRIAQIEHKTILQSLQGKLADTSFESLDAVRSVLQLMEQESQIREEQANAQTKVTELQQQLEEQHTKLTNATEASRGLVMEEIEQAQAEMTNKMDIAKQEIQTLESKLSKQQQFRERVEQLRAQADEQQQLFAEAEAELNVIDEDPAEFKRRIQAQLVDRLLSQTNQILEKLSGRYYVRAAHSNLGLALEIEDTLQKSVRRLPQTLSGGESFVVSLALALALAEIANNGKAIHSLFLDEGFGNLDADSLYLAMSTLENLKTHGKTVGIISHVDGVRKRIKTQIELVKKPNGFSELKMVA